jgi:hypothetical protein
MAFGGVSLVARFALGLGGSTNLSDTYPWGLWILFDLVWIAVAAGAFAMAGVIYVFQRKDLYGLGRTAVLMGLLSYSFVTVTLLADLGLPWHFYALALNAPEHSAMFEVSWCVGMYVTVLLFEFLRGRQVAEAAGWIFPQLFATRFEIDGTSVDPTGGPGLESSRRKPELAQVIAQRREAIGHSASRLATITDVQQSPQERAGRDHYGSGPNGKSEIRLHSHGASAFD